MTEDAGAHEARTTVTSSGDDPERVNGDQADRPGFADEERVADPDAVIIAEVTEVPDDDELAGEPGALADAEGAYPGRADDDTHPDTVPADVIAAEDGPAGDVAAGDVAAAAGGDGARHAAAADADAPAADLAGNAAQLQQRWTVIQSSFVDDPRGSVAAAADLVTETISTLVTAAQERERGLRGEWERDGVDTEALRNALRSYRRFLDQLAAL
jgi:hypothetical protein